LLLLPELRRLGLEVHAAVGGDGPVAGELAAAGLATTALDLMGARMSLRGPWQLAALQRRLRPDLVHYHGTRAAFFGALARPVVPRVPVVYTAHGLAYRNPSLGPRRALLVAAERIACAGAAHVVSVSRPDLDDLVERGLVRPGQGSHLENPVDPRHFAGGDRAAARARLALPPDAFAVLSVARLVPQKAVGDLLEALALTRHPVELVVIGEGPERPRLEELARAQRVRVRLVGERRDVAVLWPAFDAFALSSHWEGEPMALLEAMAAGLPCVATATAGAQSLLTDTPAHLVPVGDPAALARALDELAGRDPAARAAEGAALRDRVRSRRPETIARRLVEVYERLLGRTLV
jgi:glycosyltransferase involved in cell wall biosynthesis